MEADEATWLATRLLGPRWRDVLGDGSGNGSGGEGSEETATALLHYLAELLDVGIDAVRREPERLEEQGQRLHRQLETLAFNEYKAFIQSAECTKTTREQFYQINEHIAGLLERLPRLKQQCNDFLTSVGEINNSQKANRLVLQYHAQLLELLEIPQLMDTCVRNGYYEEALNMETHVGRLKARFENNTLVQNIVMEVARSSDLMLSQLVSLLQTDIKLPMCLKVAGHLRRMGRFSDTELRLLFLRARDTHLISVLATIPTSDAFAYLKKYLDVSRDHVFDIITQYRAIFAEAGYNGVLHGWVAHKVSSLVSLLDRNIDLLPDGAALATLLSQTMYFGMSLGRTGVDFRALLVVPFERAVLDMFGKCIQQGTDLFLETIKSRRWVPSSQAVSPMTRTLPSLVNAADDTVAPPAALVEFSHLGALCNAFIAAFNELRQIPILSIVGRLCHLIEASLNAVIGELVNVHTLKHPSMRTDEGRAFSDFCKAAADLLIPFVQQCLISLYPAQLAQIEQHLDVRRISGPLRPLIVSATITTSTPATPVSGAQPAQPNSDTPPVAVTLPQSTATSPLATKTTTTAPLGAATTS